MDVRSKRYPRRFAASLFDAPREAVPDVLERVRDFARAVARRHGGKRDRARLILALKGYYGTWALCSPSLLPALDAGTVAAAVAAYEEAWREPLAAPAA